MDLKLHESLENDADAERAAHAVRACVHCGFCLSTCPTYLDNRDERDSPRGRIYLLRELLQRGEGDRRTQYHLDRCLGCRACESSCPSGVHYDAIAHAGRQIMERQQQRSPAESALRWLLRLVVPYPRRFLPLLRTAQALRPLMPAALRQQIPERQAPLRAPPEARTERQVLLLDGCVQSCATPRTNQATRLILARLGVLAVDTPEQGCCGALDAHLGHGNSARDAMRRNIDAWWPSIEGGAEAVLSTATGCGAQLAEYATMLADDPQYAEKARRIGELAMDLSEYLLAHGDSNRLSDARSVRVAVQIPCSQSHALKSANSVRELLEGRGYTLCATFDDHLCCGSAGTYSLLQPAMSRRLRQRKLSALGADSPDVIASANVGCQLHLKQASDIPVVHWTELYWETLQ